MEPMAADINEAPGRRVLAAIRASPAAWYAALANPNPAIAPANIIAVRLIVMIAILAESLPPCDV